MLQAYIDDSESGGQKFAVLAGFVSTAERWEAFSGEWHDILSLHPKLEYFKAREAWGRDGQFDGWSCERRDDRVKMLRETIKRHVRVGIASIIEVEAFRDLCPKESNLFASSPYWLLYYKVIATLFEWQTRERICEPTDFIFDEQGGESGKAHKTWDDFVTGIGPYQAMLGGRPIHRDDVSFLPLQAANFLAWFIIRNVVDMHKMKSFGANQIFPYMDWEGIGIHVSPISADEIGHICRREPSN